MFLLAPFQGTYNWWFSLTGSTQFGLARVMFLVAFGLWLIAISHEPALAIAIVYTVAMWTFLAMLPRRWFRSEIGWDPRRTDTSGEAWRRWPWTALRIAITIFTLFELGFALYPRTPAGSSAHLWFALSALALLASLSFSACQRKEVLPQVVE